MLHKLKNISLCQGKMVIEQGTWNSIEVTRYFANNPPNFQFFTYWSIRSNPTWNR